MRKTTLIIIILISNLSFGQNYDDVYIEKRKVDKNNKIYSLGKEFVFKINIFDDDKTYFLKSNEGNTFELTENIDSLKISEIYLTVIKPKLFQRTNKNQTEIIFSYNPRPTSLSYTGLVENKRNIWSHPPRAGFFQALETCPFPYIKLEEPVGFKWTDSLNIGDQWSNIMWGEWKGNLLLNYEYEIAGKEIVKTNLGEIECTIVNSVAISNIGKSYLKAYYSDEYGFVKLNYTLFNGMKVSLILDKVVNGPILRNGKELMEYKHK